MQQTYADIVVVDSFWLDIKAYDENTYKKLCGTTNRWILKTPEWILERGFVLEVCTLYIPDWVEVDQIKTIARLIADLDVENPFTILAYFPEYKLKARSPTLMEMVKAYLAVEEVGLKNIKLGNVGVFAKTQRDLEILFSILGNRIL
jgi:pyruvate-formate lyase-activating enzyme